MHAFSTVIEKDRTAVLEHDRFEYVRVHGTVIIEKENVIHYVTLFEGAEAQVNKMRGVNHLAVLSGSKAILNVWESGCCIELHVGGVIHNASDLPTDELVGYLDIDHNTEAKVDGKTIIGIKKEMHK